MFGGVLETRKQKKKRERKQTKKGENLKSVGADAPDSEAFWLGNSSMKDVRVFKLTDSGKYLNFGGKENNATIPSGAIPKDILTEAIPNRIDVPSEEIPNRNDIHTEAIPNRKDIVLPNIIIRNLTSAPMLFNGEEKSNESSIRSSIRLPSVTRILSDTMSDSAKAALEQWKQKMIAQLGEEGFQIFNKGK